MEQRSAFIPSSSPLSLNAQLTLGSACASPLLPHHRRRHTRRAVPHRRSAAPVACASTQEKRTPSVDPEEALTEAELAEWAEVAALVRELAPALPADGVVAKAFGWGKLSQRFWRGDRVEEKPSVARVRESLEFLKEEVGLSDEEIGTVVLKKFPEALNLDVAERMAANVNQLKTAWPVFRGAGGDKRLKAAVLEQPSILGFSVDCGGDCISECNRCWARF